MESVNTASAMVIKELSGQRREVVLVERALPYRPFELSTSQRAEVTWYAGTPIGNGSVYGATEDPTTCNGTWKTRYLGVPSGGVVGGGYVYPMTVNGVPVQTAREAVTLFDSICREGQLLLVTWDEDARRGVLQRCRKKWLNRMDVEWELEFLWFDRGEEVPAAVIITEVSVNESTSILAKLSEALTAAVNAITIPIDADTDSQLTEFVQIVGNASVAAQGNATALNSQAYGQGSAFNRTATCLQQAGEASTAMTVELASQPACMLNSGTPPEQQTYSQRVVADTEVSEMQMRARRVRWDTAAQQAILAKQQNQTLLGEYRARQGDDLRDVSRLYYGNPYQWRNLMLFNGLDFAELTPGQIVLVPQITQQGQEAP